jgi:hypothetical protein
VGLYELSITTRPNLSLRLQSASEKISKAKLSKEIIPFLLIFDTVACTGINRLVLVFGLFTNINMWVFLKNILKNPKNTNNFNKKMFKNYRNSIKIK